MHGRWCDICRIFVKNPKLERSVEPRVHGTELTLKWILRERVWDLDWINLAHNRIGGGAVRTRQRTLGMYKRREKF